MERKIECPSCYFEFPAPPRPLESEILACPDCETELEIVRILQRRVLTEVVRIDEDWGE